MFQSPTSDSKQPGDPTHTRPPPKNSRGARPHSGIAPASPANRAAILQRSLGNQAALRLLDPRGRNPPAALQAKLVVGPANDPLEQEADRVAEQVMRMAGPGPAVSGAPPQISRKCAACEEEAKALQAKPAGNFGTGSGEAPALVHEVLRSPGQPLDAGTRAFFEPRLGVDFSRVRLHTDAKAAESARMLNARAYTLGHDVVLGTGEYAPHSNQGKALLAHEFAHVIQQTSTGDAIRRRVPATAQEGGVVRRQTGLAEELGISPDNLRDSELDAEEAPAAPAREEADSGPAIQRALNGGDGVIRRTLADTQRLCPPYAGYSAPVPLESYNCSGLAHRTYANMGLSVTANALSAGSPVGCGDPCAEGKVKHWLWVYDLGAVDSTGQPLETPHQDFHTVAGVSGPGGVDPTDVFSKNGKRPIYGPGTGPGFRPPARERAKINHPAETPISDRAGNPVFIARANYREGCFCLNCPSRNLPFQGPPPAPPPPPSAVLDTGG